MLFYLYEHIKSYDLRQLKKDILNNNLFGFVQVDIETPEDLKEKFSEMTPIFKNAEIKKNINHGKDMNAK